MTTAAPPRRHLRRRRIIHSAALALILLGGSFRLAIALRSAVSYDEIYVMGDGLEQLAQSSRDFWVDVPLRRSNAIAPLWWWLQAIPSTFGGIVSLAGLRLLPVLLGTATLVLTWFVAAHRFGRRTALILLAIVALSDVHAFTSARGECVETLLLVAALPAACWIGDWRRPTRKILLWSILPLSHLLKGGAILAMILAGEIIFRACVKPTGKSVPHGRSATWWAIVAAGFCAFVPIGVWLVIANATVFADGPVVADAGRFENLWQYIAGLTTGYSATKAHMVASAWDSAMIFFHGRVWPFTVLTCVPIATGIGLGVARIFQRRVPHPRSSEGGGRPAAPVGLGARTERTALVLSLLPWCVVGPFLVLGRGLVGSRFHLLYLPAWWLLASLAWGRPRTVRRVALVVIACVWILHVAAGFSMTSWSNLDWRMELVSVETWVPLAFVFLAMAILVRARFLQARSLRAVAVGVTMMLGAVIVSTHGPIAWGPAARFEPAPGPPVGDRPTFLSELETAWTRDHRYPPADPASFWVYMANAHLKRPDAAAADAEWAIRYADAAVHRNSADAQAWAYLGFASRSAGRPKDEIRRAWKRSYELRPDPRLSDLLRKLDESP